MPDINIENISDLDLNGQSLFEDSEGFMTELSENNELEAIYGGAKTDPGTKPYTYCIAVSPLDPPPPTKPFTHCIYVSKLS
jgi:hypothetical protein